MNLLAVKKSQKQAQSNGKFIKRLYICDRFIENLGISRVIIYNKNTIL